MDSNSLDFLTQHVRSVRRHLRRKAILRALPLGWTISLSLAGCVFLARSLFGDSPTHPSLEVGIALLAGVVLAVIVGIRRTPSLNIAALAIDRECGLKERVATALMLPSSLLGSEAGRALLHDAREQLARADLARSFAPGPPKHAFAWPLLAGGVATACFYLGPVLAALFSGTASADDGPAIDAAAVQAQLDTLKKTSAFEKNAELPRSKEFKELVLKWNELINKPINPGDQEQVRERARELQDLREKLREEAERAAGKDRDVRDALAKLFGGKVDPKAEKDALDKDGPAKELRDALAKGDFAEARKAIERLEKRRKNKELDPAEEKELAEQLKAAEDRLKRLLDREQREAALAKLHKEGKLNDGELQQELADLKELMKNLEDLEGLLDDFKEWRNDLEKLAGLDPAKMEKMLKNLMKMERGKGDLKDAKDEMARLEEARLALLRLARDKAGKGMAGGGDPGGKRPEGKAPDGAVAESPERGKLDPKGKARIGGHAWGGSEFARVPAKEVGGVIEQAVQEAPEAIERQRIPPEAAELARGYFQRLGGQK